MAVGFIADTRKTRNDNHKTIKDLKNDQDNLKRFNVGKALQFSNPKYFWNVVNKMFWCYRWSDRRSSL